MNIFTEFIMTALYAAFFQNIVLSGGYGVGEATKVSAKPKQIGFLSFWVAVFSVSAAVSCRALDYIPAVNELGFILHLLIFVGVECLLYLIAALIMKFALKAGSEALKLVGIAGFNTFVLAIPMLIRMGSSGGILDALAMALGSSVAFALSAVLINAGVKKIKANKSIPENFRFTPAVFIYIGLLALAFMGFSGQSLFV